MDSIAEGAMSERTISTKSSELFPDMSSEDEGGMPNKDEGNGSMSDDDEAQNYNEKKAPKPTQKKDDADEKEDVKADERQSEELELTEYFHSEDEAEQESTPKLVTKVKRLTKPKIDLDSGLVGPLDSGVAEQVKSTGGRRERKPVQHYAEPSSEKKAFAIVPGKGTKLADIPFIAEQISDKKRKAEDLRVLHKIFYERPGTKHDIKKNVRQFSGFSFSATSDDYRKKRERMLKYKSTELKLACSVIGLKQDKVERMVDEILEFCLKPEDTGRRPKSTSTPKSHSKKHSPKTAKAIIGQGKKKKRNSSDFDESDDEDAPPKKRSRAREVPTRTSAGGKKKYTDFDHSEEEMEADEVTTSPTTTKSEDDEEEPSSPVVESKEEKSVKGKRGAAKPKPTSKAGPKSSKASNGAKATPKKRGAASKSKPSLKDDTDSGSDNEDEEAETHDGDDDKAKTGGTISDKELTNTIKKIIKSSDLRHVTMAMVFGKVVEAYPDIHLQERRPFIKSLVRKLI